MATDYGAFREKPTPGVAFNPMPISSGLSTLNPNISSDVAFGSTVYGTNPPGTTPAQPLTEAALAAAEAARLKAIADAKAAADKKAQDEKDLAAKRDAFAIIKGVFNQYGLDELGATIEALMRDGYGPEEAALALKTDPKYNAPYLKRFKGNETRRAAGLNVLSEAAYLALENSYTETLKAYGLESYFGIDKSTKQSAMADVIGKDISAVEFGSRVSTAVDRVSKADAATKTAFSQFYGIGETDLVKYFLDPAKSLVDLKEKATTAEIGGAAIGQGLSSTVTSAQDLARYGVSREQAQVGYGQIAEDLPTAGSLGRIYSESGVTYNQADAESAQFKGLASAKRKKEQLKQLEQNQFSGSSGTGLGAGAFSTQYLRRNSSSGQF